MYCNRCAHRNPQDARFCSACGAPLLGADDSTIALQLDPDTAELEMIPGLEELQPDQALLVVKRGPNAGSKFLIDRDTTTLGRQPDCEIFLDDVTVSRRHAEVQREGMRFTVKDAGSLNGTYVNRSRVESVELTSGDELQIGKFKLLFFAAPGEGS